jgi:hypothetical protein
MGASVQTAVYQGQKVAMYAGMAVLPSNVQQAGAGLAALLSGPS